MLGVASDAAPFMVFRSAPRGAYMPYIHRRLLPPGTSSYFDSIFPEILITKIYLMELFFSLYVIVTNTKLLELVATRIILFYTLL